MFTQNAARCVALDKRTWCFRSNTRNVDTGDMTAGGTDDAGLQPTDTTEPAGLGGMQDGLVVPLRFGHLVQVHGVESRRDGSVS